MIVIAARRIVEHTDTSADYTRSCHPTEFLPVLSQICARPAQWFSALAPILDSRKRVQPSWDARRGF
jgi:hypothetical protein